MLTASANFTEVRATEVYMRFAESAKPKGLGMRLHHLEYYLSMPSFLDWSICCHWWFCPAPPPLPHSVSAPAPRPLVQPPEGHWLDETGCHHWNHWHSRLHVGWYNVLLVCCIPVNRHHFGVIVTILLFDHCHSHSFVINFILFSTLHWAILSEHFDPILSN